MSAHPSRQDCALRVDFTQCIPVEYKDRMKKQVHKIDFYRSKIPGMTLDKLADLAGVTRGYLQQIKKGEKGPSKTVRQAIASALKVPEYYLSDDYHPIAQSRVVGDAGLGKLYPIDDNPKIIDGLSEHNQPDDPGGTVDAPPEGYGLMAIRLHGDSMSPRYKDGEYVYYLHRTKDYNELINQECIVWLEDGRVAVKTLIRGATPGQYDLQSYNAPLEVDCKLTGVAEIEFHKPVPWRRR